MHELERTRNQVETTPPIGGFFLSLEKLIPSYVVDCLDQLDEIRSSSHNAVQELELQYLLWLEAEAAQSRQSYGKELATFVSSGQQQKPEIKQAIVSVESLKSTANEYEGICAAIRERSRAIGVAILGFCQEDQPILLGDNWYGPVKGPLDFRLFARLGSAATLFDWGGTIEGTPFRHATSADYVLLMNDVLGRGRSLSHQVEPDVVELEQPCDAPA